MITLSKQTSFMKIPLLAFYFLLIFGLNAQERLSIQYDASDRIEDRFVPIPAEKMQFKEYGETWFTTVIDLINLGEIPPLSSDPWGQKALIVSIFPDSTIISGVDQLTGEPYHAFVHGMADIINPSRTPRQWADQWTDVLIDSIEIPFVYTRNTHDSIVDTVFVDYIKSRPDSMLSYYDLNDNDKVDFGEFMHQSLYHTNRNTNKLDDGQVFRTDTILLSTADSSFVENFSINSRRIDVNDSVFAKERYGVYIRFQPGYEWSLNDTIDNFNEFFLLTREQRPNEVLRQIWPLTAGFCSYTLTKYVRYNMNMEAYYLLPGIVPVPEWRLEHLIISYKLTSNALSQNKVGDTFELTLFPNPVDDFLNVRFSVNQSDNIKMYIFDIMGKQVFSDNLGLNKSGENIYQYNTKHLKPGIYSIKIGELSRKFVVK